MICFLLLLILFQLKLCAVTYVIDQPGLYCLGTNITELGTNVVEITSSNVTLDLSGHTLSGGTNGIVVSPNLNFIRIRNGRIVGIVNDGISIGANSSGILVDGITILQCGNNAITVNSNLDGSIISNCLINIIGSTGISLAEECSSINIKNNTISSCQGPAISLIGTETNRMKSLLLENLLTISCQLSSTFTHVVRVDYGENVIINDLTILTSGNDFAQTKLIEFNNCTNCIVRGGLLSDNSAASLIGISLCQTQSTAIRSVNVVNNFTTTGDFTGFLLTNTSANNLFNECNIGSSTAAGFARGFDLEMASDGIIFNECSVVGLIGEDVTGFDFHYDQIGMHNALNQCSVIRNLALTGTCIGYSINNCVKSTLRDAVGSYNCAPLGQAVGLLFTGTGGSQWNIIESNFVNNIGLDDSNSYGIFVETGTNNFFTKNIATQNGSQSENQMAGVPAGSVSLLNPDNLNSANTPWGNIAITI